jgi:cytochrome c oxidase subunit 2
VAVTARKFDFSQPEIRVKKGERVTLVLSSTDFVHGFSVPDLGARVDLVPGKQVELTLRPDRAGRFVFLCDNFCGEDHDRMTGVLIVSER